MCRDGKRKLRLKRLVAVLNILGQPVAIYVMSVKCHRELLKAFAIVVAAENVCLHLLLRAHPRSFLVEILLVLKQLFSHSTRCSQARQRCCELIANRESKLQDAVLIPLHVPTRSGLFEQNSDATMKVGIG
jgi:hypothetical protein